MKHRSRRAAFPKTQSLKEQRAASLSLMLLAAVAATQTSQANVVGYGGPASLTITPELPSVQAGTDVVADVAFSGLYQQLIGAYDLTVTWNPALLSFSSVSYGPFLDGPDNSFQAFTASTGSLEVAEISYGTLANQSGSGTLPLFDVTFASIAAGTSPLAFDTQANGGLMVGDANGGSFTDFVNDNSSVEITAAPTQGGGGGTGGMSAPEIDPASAPGALTLFLGGWLVLGGRRSIPCQLATWAAPPQRGIRIARTAATMSSAATSPNKCAKCSGLARD